MTYGNILLLWSLIGLVSWLVAMTCTLFDEWDSSVTAWDTAKHYLQPGDEEQMALLGCVILGPFSSLLVLVFLKRLDDD